MSFPLNLQFVEKKERLKLTLSIVGPCRKNIQKSSSLSARKLGRTNILWIHIAHFFLGELLT